jgi:nicotinate phosphoribosyltransferase
MREAGIPLTKYGIRLDGGDLAYLSKKARKMLDAAGFEDCVISASNDLDELLIHDLKIQGAKITAWGVVTNLITSKDNPSFGGVYKLAAIQQEDGSYVSKIKLSENEEKITNPGNKTIYRIYDKETGKEVVAWTSTKEGHFDFGQYLNADKTYILKELEAPNGYVKIDDVEFAVDKEGKVELLTKSKYVKLRDGNMEVANCSEEKETKTGDDFSTGSAMMVLMLAMCGIAVAVLPRRKRQ